MEASQAFDRSRLSELGQPLKSLAQRAATGSSSSIRALHNHLSVFPCRLTWQERLLVAPVFLHNLELNAIPEAPSTDPSITRSVNDATLSLNSLASLRFFELEGHHLVAVTEFYLQHERIFRWLLFLQKHFFHPGEITEHEPLDSINFMTSNIIWAVAEFIDKVCEDVDFSSHPLILEVFFGAWKRFLGVDLHRSGQDILRIGSQLSSLTYKLLLRSLLRKTTHDIVSRMGGPSIIVAYFLAFIEDFTQQMKSINTRPAYGDLLLQQTLFNLVHLLQFSSFRDGVVLKIAIRKITAVLKWLIEDLERLPPAQRPRLPSTNDSSMHKVRLSGVIRVYYDLIGQCPWSETYYPAMDVFRLGILEKLRSSLHEDIFSADLWDEEHLFTFDAFISSLGQEASTFPRMRRHMQSILHLPSNQHHQSIWRRFDEMFELTVNTHAEAERLVDCYFGLCARPSCQQSPEHGVKLKLCSACRVSHYCSVECQKIDWTQGNHRSLCLLFQLSGSTHPLIRTNDATGIAYLASLENVWRDVNHYHSRAQTALSTHRLQSPSTDVSTPTSGLFVIQITMFEDSPATNFKVKDLADFPHLFGTESWFTVIEPRLRTFMAKKNLPEYLCVFSLPLLGSHLDLLSPLQVITISGKLSEKVKHANGEYTINW